MNLFQPDLVKEEQKCGDLLRLILLFLLVVCCSHQVLLISIQGLVEVMMRQQLQTVHKFSES
jgi:hypothetical protein